MDLGRDPRPHYRGVSHRIAFWLALVAGVVLVASAHGALPRITTAIYATLLAAMFGVSATLHRADWSVRTYNWLRRADHAAIFLCIAGTYTPFSLLGLGGSAGTKLLVLAWSACGLGVIRAVAWPHAPRAVTSACFVVAGWVACAYLPELHTAFDATTFGFVFGGGVLFTLGALIYLVRWPDPLPTRFGYHEVFHLVIIVACACHFAAVARLATM
ncbi:MAG TPA: hemolysin III family protein [Kofleriaceae bacterium]|nr:hemolysin III family protein [Kofleriaceae bacterium]